MHPGPMKHETKVKRSIVSVKDILKFIASDRPRFAKRYYRWSKHPRINHPKQDLIIDASMPITCEGYSDLECLDEDLGGFQVIFKLDIEFGTCPLLPV